MQLMCYTTHSILRLRSVWCSIFLVLDLAYLTLFGSTAPFCSECNNTKQILEQHLLLTKVCGLQKRNSKHRCHEPAMLITRTLPPWFSTIEIDYSLIGWQCSHQLDFITAQLCSFFTSPPLLLINNSAEISFFCPGIKWLSCLFSFSPKMGFLGHQSPPK